TGEHCRRKRQRMGDVVHRTADGVASCGGCLDEPILDRQASVEFFNSGEELHELQRVEPQVAGQRHAQLDSGDAAFADPLAEVDNSASNLRLRWIVHGMPRSM